MKTSLIFELACASAALVIGGCRATGDDASSDATPREAFVPTLPVAAVDVDHYALHVTLFPEDRDLQGACTLRLFTDEAGPRTIVLDLVELDVHQVESAAGELLEFVHESGKLYVSWPEVTPAGEAVTLTVRYGGQPQKGLWWVEDRAGSPLVFTHGECDESRWWFPCHDVPSDRATSELRVTMPADWTSLAAGERTWTDAGGELRTEQWSMPFPHSPYLTTLVAGRLEVVENDWRGLPLTYLAPPGWAPYLEPSLAATAPSLEFLSDLLGMRYPYTKYAQACVPGFPFGGMENITATTLTIDALSDAAGLRDHRPDVLVAHEVAHQWIGNLVTVEDWSDIWIQEGLATYLSLMFVEHTEGTDAFRAAMREKQREYMVADRGEDRRPIVHDVYRNPSDLFGSGHAYQGGATRFHLLRSMLGDVAFRGGLRRLVGRHAGGTIGTDDVRAAFEAASGEDLASFFDLWLTSPGYPEIETRWRHDPSRGHVILSVNQVQSIEDGTPSAFRASVLVEVMGTEGVRRTRVQLEKRRAKVELSCDGEPRWVRFDKYRALPAVIRSDKQTEEWLAILAEDDDLNGRLDALLALERVRATAPEEERSAIDAALLACLTSDASPAVRDAAARHVAQIGDDGRAALERAALEDADLAVRRAALGALGSWCPDAGLVDLAQGVFDDRESWATMGAAARLRVAAAPESGLDWVRARLVESSPNEILRRHLLAALGGLRDEAAVDELRRWLNDPQAFEEVRAEAGRQLARWASGSSPAARAARADLVAALDSPDGRLRRALIEAMARVDDGDVRAALASYHGRTVHDRERRAIEAALQR